MNNGFYGFPGQAGNNLLDIKEFDSSGSYEIPPYAKRLWIFLVGAGAGGGGGGRQGAGVNSFGGGGGAGGVVNQMSILVDQLAYTISSYGYSNNKANITLNVTIGAGGTGGIGATTNTASGGNGSIGGASYVTVDGVPGYIMYAVHTGASAAGQGGTSTTGTAGGTTTAPNEIVLSEVRNSTTGALVRDIYNPNTGARRTEVIPATPAPVQGTGTGGGLADALGSQTGGTGRPTDP